MASVLRRQIVILGGGISGLSLAYFLHRQDPSLQITLLEKEARAGGVIQTDASQGIVFESGPRTFLYHPKSHLLQLIVDLGLRSELLRSDPRQGGRFLWHQGALQPLFALIPWRRVARGLFGRAPLVEDMSIYDFAKRRFGEEVAETLFDPLTLGIYAGEMRRLSLRSCFPKLFAWDQGRLSGWEFWKGVACRRPLFTLRGGMSRCIETLVANVPMEIVYQQEVQRLVSLGKKGIRVEASGGCWETQHLFSALPVHVVHTLTGLFSEVSSRSLWTVNMAYRNATLPRGYGYLVPTYAQEPLLGMIWDSSLFASFPESVARVTAMVRGSEMAPLAVATEAMKTQMQMHARPDAVKVSWCPQAIPQFEVGYEALKEREQRRLEQDWPCLTLVGNYLLGASVDACIERSKCVALHFRTRCGSDHALSIHSERALM